MQDAHTHLCRHHAGFGPLIARVPPPQREERREPYQALISAIAHQQLHGNAARAILRRFHAIYPSTRFPKPRSIARTSDEALRACGFSASKIAAIRDICAKAMDGTVPTLAEAEGLSDTALIERMVTIRGVGRWTVEMMLIFTLGRPDVLPVDDFGVREGWRVLNGMEAQPKPRELAAIGEAWAPYRSMAAWYLWRAADEGKAVKKEG